MSTPHCCSEPDDCRCETEEQAHAKCDCTATRDTCQNPACCELCHGRWDRYVSHVVGPNCSPDCPMRSGYVNLTEAAQLIGVSTTTLSRHRHVGGPLERRDVRLSPTDVLGLADYFKRRPLSEVAGALVERAFKIDGTVCDAVLEEVDRVLSARLPRDPSPGL